MTLVANVTDVNDKIYDAARAARRAERASSRAEMTAAYRRRHRRRSGSAGPTTSRSRRETIGPIVELIEALIDARPRLRGRRRRLLPRALATPATASSRTATSTRWTRARASRAPTARRTRSTSRSGRRTSRARTPSWDSPWGRGRPGLAHRVLGDGRGAARRRLRHPRRRLRPRLPPPRERGRADAARRAAAARPALDAQRHGPARRARRWPSRSATSRCCTRCSTRYGPRRAGHVLRRRPLPPAARLRRRALEEARAPRAAHPRGARGGSSPGASPEDLAPLRDALLRRARRRLQHARGARRAVRLGARGQPARRRTSATPTCARCSACSGSRTARRRRRGDAPDDAALALLARRERGARASATSPTADRLRDELRGARLGGARRRRTGPELRAGRERRDRLRPQRRARGAARPRGRVRRGLGDRRARRASRGCATRVRRRVVDAEELERALRLATRHQGVCAEAGALPLRRRRRAAGARATPLIVALDQVQDPQNLGAICRTRRVRRRDRRRDPRAPRRRGDAGGLQGVGRRRRAPADRARAQPRRLPRRRQAGRAAGATAPTAERAPIAYDAARLRAAGVVLVLGARAAGCARAWRGPATSWSRCRCAGGSSR